ncbi:hypothetical protein GH742_13525 [Legionella sp. MW5194]|uniref:hypothetical protein n=1 Tax=Legionella sp. MW5194 TaxID=2662448 RepID=UPI00193E1322|nr:hypothetical protein [Legionella sp. MW5194]QRN04796.1 hypothetical protein GH742_13525 [Legionella sp. MW5194]
MGEQFLSVFLSKKTISELRQLLLTEKPSVHDLTQLIDRLDKAQAYEHLRLLLVLVREQVNEESEQKQLLNSINSILLAYACQHDDSQDMMNRLNELTASAAPDDALWSVVLEELLQWIKQSRTSEETKVVLSRLPPPVCEKFYQRLLETASGKEHWVPSFIQFVLSSAEDLKKSQHLEVLARCLILSPLPCTTEDLKSLSLLLSTPQLIDVTFHLRALASTYTSKDTPSHSSPLKHLYLSHYEELLMCLTIRATASESEYQQLTENHAELANLLMSKQLKLLDSVEEQRNLVFKLLKNCAHFNWQDKPFHAFILGQIVDVLQALSREQAALAFSQYYNYHHDRNYYDVIRLLDALFERKPDVELILHCLKQHNDVDNFFIINYLTASRTRDNKLLRGCLDMLDINQLLNFCGPFAALANLYRHEQPYYLRIYCDIVIRKITLANKVNSNFPELAAAIPDQAWDEMVDLVFNQLKGQPQVHYEWLMALLGSGVNKAKLMPYCRLLLNQPIYANQKQDILKQFSCKELFDFYLYLVRNQAGEEEFTCFVELFKETDRETVLLYILSNTPLISRTFLGKLLDSIEIKNIIYLVWSLVDLAQKDAEYKATLEQVLLHFCNRLQLTYDLNAPVHHWTDCSNNSLIAEQLLLSPACFLSLCSRSSYLQNFTPSLLQGIVCQNVASDLKLRITRVLDIARLNEASADTIALNLLSHFRESPAVLHELFGHLSFIESSLSEEGKKNYNLLKASCWALLKPKEQEKSVDDDSSVKILLTSQLTAPHRFDGVLTTLANNLAQNKDVHLSALYLTQIEPKNFDQIKPDVMVSVLLHSMDDRTQENWKKTAQYLLTQSPENAVAFLKRLISELKKFKNNPLLVNQCFQFVSQLPSFATLLPLFDDELLQWLVKESNEDYLKNNFCAWLKTLADKRGLNDIALGPLISRLPADSQWLNGVLQQPSLSPYLPAIFIELTRHERCEVHCICLYHQINKLGAAEKRKAIDAIQQHIGQSGHRLSIAAHVLTMLILDLTDIQFHNLSDKALILQQLKLFQQWMSNRDENPYFIKELESQLFNLINFLNERDIQWPRLILSDKAFASLALSCLCSAEAKTIDRHPFTTLLLNHMTVTLHPALTKDRIFQNYIKQLLLNPPALLQEDQFTLLFDKLDAEEGRQLALELLKRPALEDVQWAALLTLSRALTVNELFAIYEKSKTRFVFVDLIVRHPQGIGQLNAMQKKSLLDNLDSGKQLLRILDSQTGIDSKFAFVAALFDYLARTNTSLEAWLNRLNVDGQTLAALANYTCHEAYQTQLRQLIERNSYRQHEIRDYLHHPTLDMPLNQEGLLHQFVKTLWLHPEQGHSCHPTLLKSLDLKTLKNTLKIQSLFLSQLNSLQTFFEPFANSQEVAAETLAAARWVHRLPLFGDGLLEIIYYYQACDDKNIKIAIEGTKLYSSLIRPLLERLPLQGLFDTQLNELYALLNDYVKVFPPDNSHRKWIQSLIHRYDFSLKSMEHAASTQVYNLFLPGCNLGKMVKGNVARLDSKTIHHLVTSEPKPLPATSMSTLLTMSASHPLLLKDKEMQTWLLDSFLFSTAGRSIDNPLLHTLLSSVDPAGFTVKMREIKQKMDTYQQSFLFLRELRKEVGLSDVVTLLLKQDQSRLNLLLEACEFAELRYLTQIILLVLYMKRLRLTTDQINSLLPLPSINTHVLEWVQQDLVKTEGITSLLVAQHHCIEQEGLTYRADNKNSARLNALAATIIRQTSPLHFYTTLNSYLAVFEKKYDDESRVAFIRLLESLLSEEKNPAAVLSHLNPKLLELVTHYVLDNQGKPVFLLEQLALNGYGQKCQALARSKLQQLLANSLAIEPVPGTLDELSLEQWRQLPESDLDTLLRVQHLLYLIEPAAELIPWRKHHLDINPRVRACFGADASLFKLFTRLEQEAQKLQTKEQLPLKSLDNLRAAVAFLKRENKSLAYLSMDNYPQKSQFAEPIINQHYYRLFAFLGENPESLVDGFIEWLAALHPATLDKQQSLNELLQDISNKNLVNELAARLTNKTLHPTQATWIYTQLKSFAIRREQRIEMAATAFDWSWLQEEISTSSMPDNLALLKAAMANARHQEAILASAKSQQAFLKLLTALKFPVNELIPLLKNTVPALRSLMAIHLLSRTDYLDKRGGESLLLSLNNLPAMLLPRRLQSLTQAIEKSMLTQELLQDLAEESAASLFCSPLHFPGFSEAMVTFLLKRLPTQPRDNLIRYWLNQYATFPGSAGPLIALANAWSKQVLTTLGEMDPGKRRPLLMTLIEKHHLLSNGSKLNGLVSYCDETHLAYALQLYLHGRQDMQSLIDLIKNALATMDVQKLSSPTLQLLIRVTEDSHFADLQARLSSATSEYLRENALKGNCSLFYDDGVLSIQRLRKPLIDDKAENEKASRGLLGFLFTPVNKEPEESPSRDEPVVFNEMKEEFNSILSIHYFLIHYRDNGEDLKQLMTHYLQYCSQEKQVHHLHGIAWLMNQTGLKAPVRKILFESFWKYPQVMDGKIASCLLRYDSIKVVKRLGLQKKYLELSNLCSQSLPYLDPYSDTASMVRLAQQEADFEQALSMTSSFLREWRIWFKRCLFYGFSGWFVPKKPQFVTPFDDDPSRLELVFPDLSGDKKEPSKTHIKSLAEQLRQLDSDASLDELTAFRQALEVYDWQAQKPEELLVREQTDRVFSELLLRAKRIEFSPWLSHNMDPFIKNRKTLLAIYSQNGDEKALRYLLNKSTDELPLFKVLADEWFTSAEPPLPESSHVEPTDNRPADPGLVGQFITATVNAVVSLPGLPKLLFWGPEKPLKTEMELIPPSQPPISSS